MANIKIRKLMETAAETNNGRVQFFKDGSTYTIIVGLGSQVFSGNNLNNLAQDAENWLLANREPSKPEQLIYGMD